MKYIFWVLLLSFSSSLWAKPILHCLAEEEVKYHKEGYKYLATYRLNNELMAKIINLGTIEFQRTTLNAVCSPNTQYPSVTLLDQIIKYHEKAFVIPKTEDPRITYTQKGLIREFIKDVPNMLHDFISNVQQSCPTVDCLEKRIPLLSYYYERLKYLQMDIPAKRILREKNMAVKIMGSLKDIDRLVYDCNQELIEKKRKEEAKRKKELEDEKENS